MGLAASSGGLHTIQTIRRSW